MTTVIVLSRLAALNPPRHALSSLAPRLSRSKGQGKIAVSTPKATLPACSPVRSAAKRPLGGRRHWKKSASSLLLAETWDLIATATRRHIARDTSRCLSVGRPAFSIIQTISICWATSVCEEAELVSIFQTRHKLSEAREHR